MALFNACVLMGLEHQKTSTPVNERAPRQAPSATKKNSGANFAEKSQGYERWPTTSNHHQLQTLDLKCNRFRGWRLPFERFPRVHPSA